MPVASPPRPKKPAPPSKAKTVQFRKFRGMNLTDGRPAIEDDEFSWLENAVTVGNGAIQITPAQGDAIVTIAAGIASVWGFTLTLAGIPTPVLITVNTDGSMTQVTTAGATTVVGAAGTVSTAAHLSIWRDGPILIIDPTTGYKQWNGAALVVVDAAKLGVGIASFEGRVWIARAQSRTIEFTAPNTNNDFVAANGAGSTIITDEAFTGVLRALVSALEQLWVIGDSAIEAIANVSATTVLGVTTTTFSVTNIVTGLGSSSHAANAGYFRAVVFQSAVGTYALSGVTPQKLSDKLDGMQPALTLGSSPIAIATVQNLLVLCVLVTYTQSLAPTLPTPANGLTTATPLVLCFTQGKWFVASQGALVWITTLIVGGVSQCWGTDGSTIYQLFGGTEEVDYKIQSKLWDFGLATTEKFCDKLGFEYQSSEPITPTITIDNETSSVTADTALGNVIVFVNNAGTQLAWTNNALNPIAWLSDGMVLSRTVANMYGRYLGLTITGSDMPYRIQALQMRIGMTREWQAT